MRQVEAAIITYRVPVMIEGIRYDDIHDVADLVDMRWGASRSLRVFGFSESIGSGLCVRNSLVYMVLVSVVGATSALIVYAMRVPPIRANRLEPDWNTGASFMFICVVLKKTCTTCAKLRAFRNLEQAY